MSQADVERNMVSLAVAAVYPDGTTKPSVIGAGVKVYRGWPDAATLDKDMAKGLVHITIHPQNGMARNTTRYLGEPTFTTDNGPPTLTCVVIGGVATLAGDAGLGQVAGVIAQGVAYATRTKPSDTPHAMALRIAALMPVASTSGSSITAPGLTEGRSARDATVTTEYGRREQVFAVTIWAPNPDLRDAAASVVDVAFSRVTFLDGCRFRWRGTTSQDATEKANVYQQVIMFSAEITITGNEGAARMLWPLLATHAGGSVVVRLDTSLPAKTIHST